MYVYPLNHLKFLALDTVEQTTHRKDSIQTARYEKQKNKTCKCDSQKAAYHT